MKARSRKWLHAGLIAAFGVFTDVGAQLATGTLNLTRSVIVGLVMGGVGRILGAAIAAIPFTDEAETP